MSTDVRIAGNARRRNGSIGDSGSRSGRLRIRLLALGAAPVLVAGMLALPVPAIAAAPAPAAASRPADSGTAASPVDTRAAEAQLDKILNTPATTLAAPTAQGATPTPQAGRAFSPADATGGSCFTVDRTQNCYFGFSGSDPHTGSVQTFTVPIGVTQLTIDLWGARSAGNGTDPGNGGHVNGAVPVTAGEVLSLSVGGIGTGTSGGWPDGGDASTGGNGSGCAGGGGTRLTGPGGDIAEAGGGGGCGGGGDKQGNSGDAGRNAGGGGGGGGDCGGNGGGGATTTGVGGGGGGWSGSCDGLIGSGAGDGGGGSGHRGGGSGGGNDSLCCNHGYSGGGGGGGWFGGGGGGGGGHYGGGGGGGGGGLNGWNPSLVNTANSTSDTNSDSGFAYLRYALADTTTTLTVTPSVPATVGGPVTLSAQVTVAGGGGVQAGTVTFSGAAGICGPAAVDPGTGEATCSFASTAAADSTVTARYDQIGAYGASSASAALSVAKDTTSTTISSVTPSGTTATVAAAVALVPTSWGTLDADPKPTVTISASGASNSQCVFSVSDAARSGSCQLNGLVPGGSYTYLASYQGTSTTGASADTKSDQTLPRLATTTAFTAGSGDVQGNAVGLTALTVSVPSSATTVPIGDIELWSSPSATSIDPADGAVRLCSVPVTGSGGSYSPSSADLATCNAAPALVGASFLIAAYPGDPQTAPSQSGGSAYTTTAAPTKLVLTGASGSSPLTGTLPSNTPVSLTAAVTYTSAGLLDKPAIGGTVTFKDGGTPISCASLTNGGRTCTFTPKIRDGATRVFSASFAGVPEYATASSSTSSITVTLTAPASSLNFSSVPATVAAGAPVTLTVTLQSADPDAGGGQVDFYDAADRLDPICSAVLLSPATLTASCVAHPAPGATVAYFARYTNDPNIGVEVDTLTQPKVTAGAAGTATVTSGIAASTFGAATALSATVTSAVTSPRAQPVGIVTFTQGSTVLCAVAVATNGPGTAIGACSTTALIGGDHPVVATFASSGSATTGSVAPAVTASVAPAATTVRVNATVATTTTAMLSITVGAGLPTPPVGTVSVSLAGSPVAGCTGLTLTAGAVSCSPVLPVASGNYTYTATYLPGNGNFATATGTGILEVADVNVPCSGGFQALDQQLQRSGTLAIRTGYATVTGAVDPVTTCTAATVINFSAVSATLFHAVAGTVSGSITQDGGLCLTGGSFGPTGGSQWVTGTYQVVASICFALGADGTPSGLTGGTLASTSAHPVPLVHLAGLGAVGVTLTFGHATGAPATLTLQTTLTTTSGPTATLTGSIAGDGSAALQLTTANLTLFGSAVQLSGSVTRDADGTVGYAATAELPGPLTPAGAPGLSFTDVRVNLSNDGLDLTGTGSLGAAGKALSISLQATIANAGKWTLSLTTSGDPWTPVSGLSISTALTGTVGYDAAQTKPYTYDFTGGDDTSPFVTWSTQSGASVTVTKVELSSTASCAGAGAGDPVLSLDGSATAGGTSAFAVAVTGCVDLATSAFEVTGTADKLAITPGLELDNLAVDLTGSNVAATLSGSATATVDSGGTTLTVPMRLTVGIGTGKALVVGGAADLSSVGLPVVGFVAFASAPVDSYDTGLTDTQLPGGSQIALSKGLTARGVITLDSGTAADLTAVGITSGATLTFAATLSSASSASFELGLNIPTLQLYNLTVTDLSATASFTREAGATTFRVAVEATVPSESGDAALKVDLDYAADHTLTGTGSLTNLAVFGHPLSLSGAFTHAAGKLTGSLTLAPVDLAIPLPAGAAVTVAGFTATLGTDGLSVAGTVAIPGAPSGLTVSGTLHNLRNYSISVSGLLSGWSPTPGVTVARNTSITGTLTSKSTIAILGRPSVTRSTVDLRAAGNLLTLSPVSAVSFSVTSIELSNGAPVGCTVTRAGDLWLGVSGNMSATVGSTLTVTAVGCFDITSGALSLAAALPVSYTAPGGNVSIHDATLTFAKSGPTISVSARATLTIAFDQAFDVSAVLQFSRTGFIVGAGIDMSKYLGAGAVAAAYIFFSSAPATAVPTDQLGNFGLQNFAQGITVLGKVSVPAALADWLKDKGIDLPGGSSLVAKGVLDLANRAVTLSILVDLGADGQQLFSAGGSSLALNSGGLELSISPTLVSFGLVVNATLTVAPPTSDACNTTDNTIGLTGRISLTGQSVTGSFTVLHWQNALGLCGLTVDEFTVQLGIDAEGIPSLGFVVQVSSLPARLAEAIGYQSGTILKLAVNISVDNFLVDIEIGTKGSGQAALKPLTIVNQPDLLVVNYAKLYISPNGAKIGGTVYPAGYALIFNASVKGVTLDFDLEVNPAKLSLHFDATVGQIHIGGLTFGPTEIVLDAQGTSPYRFDFRFKGEIHLGPGTVDVGPLLRFRGYLDAAVDISVGTSGFAASITADASVQGSNYLPQSTCWYQVIFPYPCDYQWVDDAPLTIPRFTIGIAINSDGVDLQVPGIDSTIHLPFSSNHAETVAFAVGSARVGTDNYSPDRVGSVPVQSPAAAAAGEDVVVGHSSAIEVQNGTFQVVDRSSAVEVQHATAARSLPSGAAALRSPMAAAVPTGVDPTTGVWSATAALDGSRAFAGTVVLADGSVLVAGGGSGAQALASAELFQPATGSWRSTGSMSVATAGAGTVALADGRVLVAGGASSSGVLAAAQVYDPASGRWTQVGSMTTARQFPVATRLADGRVLVAGGRGAGDVPLASAEVFDPATGSWRTTGSMATGREIASGVTLRSGKVLVTAGMGASGPLASSELYDPATGRWSATGAAANARFGATTTLLPDGSVLLSGDSAFAELYQPATGAWTRTGSQHSPRTFAATVSLPGGGVLTVGGFVGTVGSPASLPSASTAVESYDPVGRLWTVDSALPAARAGASAAPLNNGTVLAAGGLFDGTAQHSAYLLAPPAPGGGNGGSGGSGGSGGNNGGSGNGGPTPPVDQTPPQQSLSYTGIPADTEWIALGALLSVLVGTALVLAGRRRRRTD